MRRTRPAGFTLLEVLVALAIFIMVAVPLLNLEMASTAQTARVNLARRGHAIATEFLDKWMAESFKGERTEKVEDFEVRARTHDIDDRPGFEQLTVTVTYRGEPAAELSIFREHAEGSTGRAPH